MADINTPKLLVIAPPLLLPSYRSRWKHLANREPYRWRVRALVPKSWGNKDYGKDRTFEPEPEVDGNFELKPIETTSNNNSFYKIRNFRREIAEFQPDYIFCVHHEGIAQLRQCILTRWFFFRKVKLIYFSMTAFPRVKPLVSWHPKEIAKYFYFRLNWWLIKYGTDGALCHYDRIENQMRKEGYQKPILQQTQYGVNPEQFKPDPTMRKQMREKLGLTGTVIGFCGRFVDEKGLREIMQAVEQMPDANWQLLLIGDGPLRSEIETWIEKRGFQERVKLAGFIPHHEVHNYFQAMDIFYLGSKETPKYIDTFPLVVAQAMTIGIPVVGSISGAIPYQLANESLLFSQGDVDAIVGRLRMLIKSPEKRKAIGESLSARSINNFCIDAMNQKLIRFIEKGSQPSHKA